MLARLIKCLFVCGPIIAIVLVPNVPGYLLLAYVTYLVLLIVAHTKLVHRVRLFQVKSRLDIELVGMFVLILVVIAALDYSVVETFKQLSTFPETSPYWYNLFNIVLPVLWAALAFAYYLGKQSVGEAIKVFIAGVLLEYSSINDYMYYLLNGVALPDKWTWLKTPQFLFGETITTPQLLLWTAICVALAFFVLSLPLQRFVWYKEDGNLKEKL